MSEEERFFVVLVSFGYVGVLVYVGDMYVCMCLVCYLCDLRRNLWIFMGGGVSVVSDRGIEVCYF